MLVRAKFTCNSVTELRQPVYNRDAKPAILSTR
jgi:hypothetical protein